MIKAIFFDVDGTLFSHKIAAISQSNQKCISKLQQKGIKVFIATGRALPELEYMKVTDIPFDGYALINGQLTINKEKEVIYGCPIDQYDIDQIIEPFNNMLFPIILIEKDRMYINYVDDHVIDIETRISSVPPKVDKYHGDTIYQMMFYTKNLDAVNKLDLPHCRKINWFNEAFDVLNKDGDKTNGMIALLEHYHISKDEVMAFGDGNNDVEMIKFAKIGVAMGNATEACKQASDYVTSDMDDDGIYKALKHFNII